MKKLLSLLLVLCMILGIVCSSALADFGSLNQKSTVLAHVDDPDSYGRTGEAGRTWTVMIYMSGTNLESEGFHACATNDMREMVGAGYDQSRMTVLLLAGGATRWKNAAIDADDHAIYELVGDTFVKRQSLSIRASLGDPATLSTLLNYGHDNYPAEHYALVLWDHGGGPNGGAIHDDNNLIQTTSGNAVSDWLTADELADGLANSFASGRKLDVFAWHACLMGSFEVACLMAPYADYMCCSEETMSSAEDLNYAFFRDLVNCRDGYEAGSLIMDCMMTQASEKYGADFRDYSPVMTESLIDLSKIPALSAAADDFFQAAGNELNQDSYPATVRMRSGLYNYSSDEASFDMVDLQELVTANRNIAPEKADAVLAALDQAVCRNWLINIDDKSAAGLTVWYPYNAFYATEGILRTYEGSFVKNFGFPEHYVSYIRTFSGLRASGSASGTTWNRLNGKSSDGNKANQTVYQLQLSDDQVAELLNHSIVVMTAVPAEDGSMTYAMVSESATELDGNVVRGSYVNRGLFVLDAQGQPVNTVPLTWREQQVGSKTYVITEVTLYDAENNDVNVCLYCERGENNTLRVAYAKPYDPNMQSYASASTLDLNDFTAAAADIRCLMVNPDESIENWTVGQTLHVEWPLADCTLALLDDQVALDSLYGAFQLEDIYKNVHVALINGESEDAVVIDCDDVFVRFNACDVRVDGNVYITVTVENPTDNETAIEISGLRLNGQAVEIEETWLEGNGPNEGILPGESSTVTIVAAADVLKGMETLNTITMSLTVVDAANETELAIVPAMVSLTMPLN